jgi:hypothetical protein
MQLESIVQYILAGAALLFAATPLIATIAGGRRLRGVMATMAPLLPLLLKGQHAGGPGLPKTDPRFDDTHGYPQEMLDKVAEMLSPGGDRFTTSSAAVAAEENAKATAAAAATQEDQA